MLNYIKKFYADRIIRYSRYRDYLLFKKTSSCDKRSAVQRVTNRSSLRSKLRQFLQYFEFQCKIWHEFLKSMWNNMVDNKTCNLNFSVTFDLSDESRERSSPSNNSAKLRSRLFFQKINRRGEIQYRKVSSIFLAPIHVSHTLKSWKKNTKKIDFS